MSLEQQLLSYLPYNEQEVRDRELILRCLKDESDVFTRKNDLVHMTASAWIVNADRTKVLMAYHNLYQSWAWLGGHADGETDLLAVALKEAQEESGLAHVWPVMEQIYSVESLHVCGHVKRGRYVSSHIHLNVTYLLEADENDPLFIKADENSGVAWFAPEEAEAVCTEPWMRDHIYHKLNEKLRTL
ncbi:MAG: NUDIX hydrolase [bacterium]|nr:NUDIX hydrolase [bacterium]